MVFYGFTCGLVYTGGMHSWKMHVSCSLKGAQYTPVSEDSRGNFLSSIESYFPSLIADRLDLRLDRLSCSSCSTAPNKYIQTYPRHNTSRNYGVNEKKNRRSFVPGTSISSYFPCLFNFYFFFIFFSQVPAIYISSTWKLINSLCIVFYFQFPITNSIIMINVLINLLFIEFLSEFFLPTSTMCWRVGKRLLTLNEILWSVIT